jgi:hypothetical protein
MYSSDASRATARVFGASAIGVIGGGAAVAWLWARRRHDRRVQSARPHSR